MGTPIQTADCRDAIEALPAGATLVVPGVEWDQYENLVRQLDRPGVRISYEEGRLEVVSPGTEHERYKETLSDLVRAFSEEAGLPLEKLGSTTWKSARVQRGIEPDASFYVPNAHRVAGRLSLDLEHDPPPDLAVEIDTTNESLGKLSIYAALGVPEIWRYDCLHLHMYRLDAGRYEAIDHSEALPGLTATLLEEFLELARTETQTRLLHQFRQRLRARETSPNPGW